MPGPEARKRGRKVDTKGGGPEARETAGEEFKIGSKIKVLRLARKKTLQEVADETGFSPALISQIENNNVSPPIATLSRIAKVLGVRVGYFFKDEGPEEAYEVVRKDERPAITRVISRTGGEHGYTYHALTYKKRDKIMEPFLLAVDPNMRDEETLYSHEGEEFLLVLEGEAELLLESEHIVLAEGDCVYFESTLKHRLLSHGGRGAKVLAVLTKGM
ncbi:MAG: helix-turn-helix transcriptional regulator [Deltaproteobacteria bacterium]|nr:helix-turn-helix transcriptional regulator [Deltaproteobacteria bacterium]